MKRTIVYDGDDTLWECQAHYTEAFDDAASYINDVTGLPAEHAKALLSSVHVVGRHALGVDKGTFPSGLVAGGVAARYLTGRSVPMNYEATLQAIGEDVYNAPYTLREGARELLQLYHAAGWRQVLYTKGDPDVQNMKVDKHELRHLFNAIHVVRQKNTKALREVCLKDWIEPSQGVYIGDSLRDDIAPAHDMGFFTVYVPKSTPEPASYDTGVTVAPHAALTDIRSLVDIIPPATTARELAGMDGGEKA